MNGKRKITLNNKRNKQRKMRGGKRKKEEIKE